MQYREFGKTGEKVSALGFGCMRLPTLEDGKIDRPRAIAMIRNAIDNGVNYMDTAYMYHGGENLKVVLGLALQDGYREKVKVADKMPLGKLQEEGDFERIFEEQLSRLGVDYLDFYLLHNFMANNIPKLQELHIFEKMVELKKSGRVRHIGFSSHDELDNFKKLVDMLDDEWEFCQIQYNYEDTDRQAGQEGLEYAAARGWGVISMEPLQGGRLANPVESVLEVLPNGVNPVEFALKFVWGQPGISLLLSGMSTEQQVEDNLRYAEEFGTRMISDEERNVYAEVKKRIDAIKIVPCTKCRYCMPCPFGVDIPGVFDYNATVTRAAWSLKGDYKKIPGADLCKKCGKCEEVCPQHISIREQLEKAHKVLG